MGFRFTNPWWVVFGAVTGLFVCNGPVLGFTFGVFLKPIMADTGWQRSSVSFALSVGGIFSALAVPVLGRMMDRWGIRCVMLPGLVVYAICLSLVGAISASFWIFTLVFAVAEMTSASRHPSAIRRRSLLGSIDGAGSLSALQWRGWGLVAPSYRSLLTP